MWAVAPFMYLMYHKGAENASENKCLPMPVTNVFQEGITILQMLNSYDRMQKVLTLLLCLTVCGRTEFRKGVSNADTKENQRKSINRRKPSVWPLT